MEGKYLFWLYKSKMNKTGKAPIYFRIMVGKTQAECSTGVYVKPSQWDSNKSKIKGESSEALALNIKLIGIKEAYFAAYIKLLDTKEPCTAQDVKLKMTGKEREKKEHTLMEAMYFHLNKVQALVGKDYSKNTYIKHKVLVTLMPDFLRAVYKKKDIPLNDIPKNFAPKFIEYMKIERDNGNNSAMKRVQSLKTILNEAVTNGWIDRNPLQGFRLKYKPIKLIYLTDKELELIEQKEFKTDRLKRDKDMFLLMCYTGLSYKDLKKIKYRDIVEVDGNKWLFVERTKTGVTSQIPLSKKAVELLDVYAGKIPSNQKMNEALKEIASFCKIDKNLTCHVGRRTFAMHMLNSGVSIESVAAMLGHSSTKITQQHYAKVLPKRIFKEVKGILNKVRMFFLLFIVGVLLFSCSKRDLNVRTVRYNTKNVPFEIPKPDSGRYEYLNIQIFSDGYALVMWKQPHDRIFYIKSCRVNPDGSDTDFGSMMQPYQVLPSYDTVVVQMGVPYKY